MDREYTHMDRTGWGPGPWDREPDKTQWVDEETDLDCLIVRNGMGALCGYVGVPSSHPWHGIRYGDRTDGKEVDYTEDQAFSLCVDSLIDVHGGLTFSNSCDEESPVESGICHVPLPGRPDDVWWFGFDCSHYGDRSPAYEARGRLLPGGPYIEDGTYKTIAYVRWECASLARQLMEATA